MPLRRLPDRGDDETEKLLSEIEKRISGEYAKAEREIQQKLNDYLAKFQKKDELKRRALAAGEITQAEYDKWRLGQIMIGQRWDEMRTTLAEDLANVDQIARSIAFGHLPEVYAINHNYGTFQVETGALVDTSYTLYDRHTVERLCLDDEGRFIPAPGRRISEQINLGRALPWNKKNVQSVMMQGIMQGESIPNLATRLAKSVGEQNRGVAIRNARTLVTGVQNAGRMDSYERAKDMGIKVKKQWLATLDMRTRHWHVELDGVSVDVDEPFENEYGTIMFPGDPEADPSNIYNCRCTMIAAIEGFERDLSDLGLRHDDHLEGMTYDEWKEEHETYSEPITRQDQIAATMRRIYGAEYAHYATLPEVENNGNIAFNKTGDPLLDAMGTIDDSNPGAREAFTRYAEGVGVEVVSDSPSIAYAPGLKPGMPGQLHVSMDDSYGAWLHEMQHLKDDEADGWLGFEGLLDPVRRTKMEYAAYKQEIDLAMGIGRPDIAQELKEECRNEIERIGGVWDEERLK